MTHKLKGRFDSRDVWLDGQWLDPAPSQKVRNHSPDGFSWGYSGSGPAQLALAIVLHLTGKADGYQEFKRQHIATLPHNNFELIFEYPETIERFQQQFEDESHAEMYET